MAGFEDVYDALWGIVNALGGPKKVGPRLRPEYADAAQWLRNCLNREHAQKLDPEQVCLLKRWACEAGYHDAKHWEDREQGYQPGVPLTLEAHLAAMLKQAQHDQRKAEESQRNLRELTTNPEFVAWAAKTGLKLEGESA